MIGTIERRPSRPSDNGRRISGHDVATCWSPAAYDASDSEHEQPAWQVPRGAGRRAEREASTSSSESESSDGGIDDDSLLERMAAAARRGARRVALRNAIGHRATRRVERYGGLPLATIQQRWDSAMTMPAAGADGVRANDDDSTSTRATRGGDVTQGQATAGREARPSSRTQQPGTLGRPTRSRGGRCDSVRAMRRAEAAAVGDSSHGCRRARSRRGRRTEVRRQPQEGTTNRSASVKQCTMHGASGLRVQSCAVSRTVQGG